MNEKQLSLGQTIALPEPQRMGSLSLEEALIRRRSVREYRPQALKLNEIGQLLWAAQGITDPSGRRAAPSAGNLQSLELYLLTAEGVYHYLPQEHALKALLTGDLHQQLSAAARDQESILNAPAVFVIAAVYGRLAPKYGEERSRRYAHIEAGHAAQNLLLQAAALGLAAVPAGAFNDLELKQLLQLPDEQQPLYLLPVGYPK